MSETRWKDSITFPGGIWAWKHDQSSPYVQTSSDNFGDNFYGHQPRHGMYASSRWDLVESHAAAYPALGSANVVAQLKPLIARHICLVWEMSVLAASTGRVKFYIVSGANREILTLQTTPGSDVTEVTTTNTSYEVKKYIVRDLSSSIYYSLIADAEGEDVTFEIYLENTVSTVRLRNFRMYSALSAFPADYPG